jgi:hypothetical protein
MAVKEWPQNKGLRENPHEFDFPHVQQIAANTIGLDLVPVVPMDSPTGLLMYLDYKYEKLPWYRRLIKWIKNILSN